MPLIKLMSEAYKYLQQYKQKIINININKKNDRKIYQIKYTYHIKYTYKIYILLTNFTQVFKYINIRIPFKIK